MKTASFISEIRCLIISALVTGYKNTMGDTSSLIKQKYQLSYDLEIWFSVLFIEWLNGISNLQPIGDVYTLLPYKQ